MTEMDLVPMLCGLYESIFLTLAEEDSHVRKVRYLCSLSRRDFHGSFSVNVFWACAELIFFFPLKEIETFYEKIYLSSFFFALHFIQLSCHHMWHNFTLR